MEGGGWRRGQKYKATDCGCGWRYRLRILGNPGGIFVKESGGTSLRRAGCEWDAINNQAA